MRIRSCAGSGFVYEKDASLILDGECPCSGTPAKKKSLNRRPGSPVAPEQRAAG
jgi:hypothetical protein